MHAHFSRDMRQNNMSVFQLHLEHRIGERLNDRTLEFNGIFFTQKPLLSKVVAKQQQTMLPHVIQVRQAKMQQNA